MRKQSSVLSKVESLQGPTSIASRSKVLCRRKNSSPLPAVTSRLCCQKNCFKKQSSVLSKEPLRDPNVDFSCMIRGRKMVLEIRLRIWVYEQHLNGSCISRETDQCLGRCAPQLRACSPVKSHLPVSDLSRSSACPFQATPRPWERSYQCNIMRYNAIQSDLI